MELPGAPVGLLPAVLAGLACLLVVAPPGAGLHRIGDPAGTAPPRRDGLVASAVLTGAGAMPLRNRLALGGAVASALCAALAQTTDLGGPALVGWPVVVATTVVLLGRLEPRSAQDRAARLVADVPQALELMADGLAAGRPLRDACAAVVDAFDGPVTEELGVVLRSMELGTGQAAAWAVLRGHPQLGDAAADLSRAAESGTELVAALRLHAASARDRRRAALQQRARSVGVRSVLPLMTCFLPAFLLLGVVPTVVSAVVHAFG